MKNKSLLPPYNGPTSANLANITWPTSIVIFLFLLILSVAEESLLDFMNKVVAAYQRGDEVAA